MANLQQFREKVAIYRKRQDTSAGTPHTQQELAMAIGLSPDELGHRLRGTGRSPLTRENVLAIVRTLAEWETLMWDEAIELLVFMDYPLDQPHWKTELQRFLLPSQSDRRSSVTSAGTIQEKPPVPLRHRLFQARDLPRDYVPRPTAFDAIKRLLLTHEENQATAITTALRGSGGFGKTTLASALCHDPDIQAAFPDGILWVELGEHPPRPLDVLNGLLQAFEPSLSGALTLEEARERWRKALQGRVCLLAIDDVWQTEALEELLKEGPHCGRLVTTRNDQILPEDAKRVWVDAMEPEEAMALLCQGVVEDWPQLLDRSVLEQVAVQQLGCWPLLVSLARGMLTNQARRLKKTPEQALALVKQAYEDRGMAAFHLGDRIERQRTADACVEVNLRQLEEWVPSHYQARQRYQELAIFPEDTDIPLMTLQTYWQGTGGLHAWEVDDLCLCLSDLSLLLPLDREHATIRLHDVMRSYLIQHVGSHLPALHGRLLDACQQELGLTRWADLPRSAAYLWQHLVLHLCQAGRPEALQTTLTDLSYLTRKALYVGVAALESDLLLARMQEEAGATDATSTLLVSLHRTVVRISHLLRQVATEAEMGGLLLSHLGERPPFVTQRSAFERELARPFLTAWHPLPETSSPALICTLYGHTSWVTDCAVSMGGRTIVSASQDDTLKVWDGTTGEERLTLSGHRFTITGCAVSPDGRTIVSASQDDTLKVWDVGTGKMHLTNSSHHQSRGCAVSADRRTVISTSDGGTLKVWDGITGEERFTLAGLTLSGISFPVTGCAVSLGGRTIVSASWIGKLQVWNGITGKERLTISTGHQGAINDCALSLDGRTIVSASADGTLKVWDASTGKKRFTLAGHRDAARRSRVIGLSGAINGCAISLDGRTIVSASTDHTLKVWDMGTRKERLTLSGHRGEVKSCAVSGDGGTIVSASTDHTLKVWDGDTGEELLTLLGHRDDVTGCAVSGDGHTIVSVSEDDTLKVWEMQSGRCLLTFPVDGPLYDCAFHPEGEYLVACGMQGVYFLRLVM